MSFIAETGSSRILVVSNLYPPDVIGGAEIVAQRQARGLAARGNVLAVLTGGFPDGDAEPGSLSVELVDGIRVYRIVHRSFDPALNFYWPAAERRLTAILSSFRPDVVHFHNVAGLGAFLIPVARRAGALVVVTLHDYWGICYKNTMLRNDGSLCDDPDQCALCLPSIEPSPSLDLPIRFRRDAVAWCLDRADCLIAPSQYLSSAYNESRLLNNTVRKISNGIDLSRVTVSSREQDGVIRFACFSYLGFHKGIKVLLDAAEMLTANTALSGRWTLTVAGHGELAGEIENKIAEGRFGGAVSFVGRLAHDEALRLLTDVDVVVLGSIWPENEPVTMLEAIAAGKAQLATRIGGHLELVVEGRSGILVDPGSADDLASAFTKLIVEPGLSTLYGDFNAGRRENFDERATLDALLGLYRSSQHSCGGAEIVIICVGSPKPMDLGLLLHRFHIIEGVHQTIRFIWHEWACIDAWSEAKVVWVWGEDTTEIASVITRALRAGLPLLLPDGSALSELAMAYGLLASYRTITEAAGILAALAGASAVQERAHESAPAAARLLNAIQPDQSFALSLR